ncbi:Xaa-Pro peptidase family protein [Mesorhizobium sp. M1136]|uniref:M24 family metallopeptidase n=1 Tax=Mesorhizobium sp. M1136 TaxID=2957059 RepID=UPI00333D182F
MSAQTNDLRQHPNGKVLTFALREFEDRVGRLDAMLQRENIDIFLGHAPESLNYFTGFDPLGIYLYECVFFQAGAKEPSLLTHKAEKELTVFQCWISEVIIWTHGYNPVQMTIDKLRDLGASAGKRVGIEMANWYLQAELYKALTAAFPGVEFVDVTQNVMQLRTIKSPTEIEYMRKAASFSDLALQATAEILRPGVSELEVLAAVQSRLALAGSEYPTLPFIIASGWRSGTFHAVPSSKIIEAGDPLLFEFTGSWKRYNSNLCRTVVAGKASDRLLDLWKINYESFWRPFELIRPGASVSDIDRLSRDIRGQYSDFIVARAGFGMGLSYPPTFAQYPDILVGDETVLEPGMIFSLEPSISQFEGLTISYGYNILVTESGAEILQKTPKDLFEINA